MNKSNGNYLTNFSMSNSSSFCKFDLPDTDLQKIAKHTSIISVCGLGIVFNIFIIVVAFKVRPRRNLHFLIMNLAVSDTLFSLTSLLWYFEGLIPGYWKLISKVSTDFSLFVCKCTVFVYGTSFRVSAITLLVISFQRFIATRRTFQRSRPYTLKKRIAVLCACWLVPMGGAVRVAYVANVDYKRHKCVASSSLTTFFMIMSAVQFVFLFCVCMTIATLSLLTLRRLSKHQAIHGHLNEEQLKTRKCRIRQSVKMVLTSVMLYVCCWIPSFCYSMLWFLDRTARFGIDWSACIDWRSLDFVVIMFLPVLNSALSPVIYLTFLNDFKETGTKLMCCCVRQKRNRRISVELQ